MVILVLDVRAVRVRSQDASVCCGRSVFLSFPLVLTKHTLLRQMGRLLPKSVFVTLQLAASSIALSTLSAYLFDETKAANLLIVVPVSGKSLNDE